MRWILVPLLVIAFMGVAHAQSIIFSDNFNDQNIADWTKQSGTWNVNPSTLDLNGGGLDGAFITHTVGQPSGQDYNFSYQTKPVTTLTNGEFLWFFDETTLGSTNGYELLINDVNIILRKRVGGVPTNLKSTASGVSLGNYHDVNIFHKSDGNINVFVDNVSIGSIIDNTYSAGSLIGFATEANDSNHMIDNVVVRSTLTGSSTVVSILKPIDERTLLPINDTNWTVTISGTVYGFINDSSTMTFVVPKVNGEAVTFMVNDSNVADGTDYFARSYAFEFETTDANTFILQPYLIESGDGIAVNFIIKDKLTSKTLAGLMVDLNRGINDTLTTVEKVVSNAAGISQFTFLAQTNYNLSIVDINTDITYFPTSTNDGIFQAVVDSGFTIEISYTTSDLNVVDYNHTVIIFPVNEKLTGTSQKIDVNVLTNYADSILIEILDNNIVQQQSLVFTQTSIQSFTINPQDYNLFVIVRAWIIADGVAHPYHKLYVVINQPIGIIGGIQGAKSSLGLVGSLIITILGVLLILQAYGSNIGGDNESQLFVVAMALAIFALMFFYEENANPLMDPMIPLYAALLFGAIAWWWKKG